MDEHILTETVKADPIYQQLLSECISAEKDFNTLCKQLSPDAQARIERYLTAREELDHRKLQLLLKMLP